MPAFIANILEGKKEYINSLLKKQGTDLWESSKRVNKYAWCFYTSFILTQMKFCGIYKIVLKVVF